MKREYLYAATFLMLALLLAYYSTAGGWNWLLLWPAVAFAVVAFAYSVRSPRPFQKRRDGSRSLLATVVLFPYLSFAYAVWFLQACLSRELSNVKLNDSLFISRRLFGKELPQEVNRVCDLSSEFSDPARIRRLSGYLCYPILDASTCDPSTLIELAKSLPPMPDSPLLIHCANGHGRTGMFAAIWLLTHGFAQDAAQAILLLKAARPQLKLGTDQHATVENAAAILTRQ